MNEVVEFVLAYLDDEEIEACGGMGPVAFAKAKKVDEERANDLLLSMVQAEMPVAVMPEAIVTEFNEATESLYG